MHLDLRTRNDLDVHATTIDVFFGSVFPNLWQQNAHYVKPWLAEHHPGSLTIESQNQHWHLVQEKDGLVARAGAADTGLKVALSAEEFSGLINDLYTPMTFFVGGTLDIARGNMHDFLNWWLILRALIDGRPIHHANSSVEFLDPKGKPLDLRHTFQADDPVEDMRHFLQTAGFLHIGGLFSEQEMHAISADIDANQHRYHEGDNNSWWATTGSGQRKLVRLQGFDKLSPATAALLKDPRFLELGDISGAGHRHSGIEGNAIEALIKPLDVVKGISDLPWHKDCSLGRHSYDCCSLTVGVSVTAAGPKSGQLRVIAGSHRVLMWPSLINDEDALGLPIIDLPTQTGDITMHLSCTHHMAQAPTAEERRVLYTSFCLEQVSYGSGNPAKERIMRSREGAYKTVSQ